MLVKIQNSSTERKKHIEHKYSGTFFENRNNEWLFFNRQFLNHKTEVKAF